MSDKQTGQACHCRLHCPCPFHPSLLALFLSTLSHNFPQACLQRIQHPPSQQACIATITPATVPCLLTQISLLPHTPTSSLLAATALAHRILKCLSACWDRTHQQQFQAVHLVCAWRCHAFIRIIIQMRERAPCLPRLFMCAMHIYTPENSTTKSIEPAREQVPCRQV